MIAHLRPSAEIAPDAILPGDPGRALAIAQDLLERPLMANHARGLWGYSGTTAAGSALTVQATGIGGPSLAIVVSELAELGVGRAVRLGTCRALVDGLEPGTAVVANRALATDGASRELGAAGLVNPDPELTGALAAAAGCTLAIVAGADLHHGAEAMRRRDAWLADGAVAADLATATLFALAARLGMAVASALVVAEGRDGRRLDDEEIEAVSLRLGRAAASALANGVKGAVQDSASRARGRS